MRTAYRVLSTALAVGSIFPIGIQPAHAATTMDVKVETAAWFWSTQVSGEAAPGVPYPGAVPRPASGIPEGDLAVAYKGDKEANPEDGTQKSVPDKETYLLWDIYSIPEGSIVDSFTFTVFVDTDAKNVVPPLVEIPGQGSRGGQPKLVACPPTIGFGEADGDSFDAKPDDNCADQIFGEFDAKTNSYTFHATTFAQDWVDGLDNFGLGIRNTEEETEPFQLALKPADTVKATISYTPPVAEPTQEPTSAAPVVPIPTVPTVDTPVFAPPLQPQPEPQPVVPQPTPNPAPVVMTKAPVVAVQNVAANPLLPSRRLTANFWFAMAGGVLLLGALSLILGDPLAPAATPRTRGAAGRHRLNAPAGAPARLTRQIRPRTV